jgi:tetratricopeptide (TPR) repeat protein
LLTVSKAYVHKGIALLTLKRCPEAFVAFDQAIKINPKDAISYNFRGLCLFNTKKTEEAIASYNKGFK